MSCPIYLITFLLYVFHTLSSIAEDIELPQTNILIPSKTRRVMIPLRIVDDQIAEFLENVIVALRGHGDHGPLYKIESSRNQVNIEITDNEG